MITKTCIVCGKEFKVYPSQNRRNRKFCSRQCLYQYYKGEKSPHWKGGKIQIQCKWCGKTFSRHPSLLEGRKNYFCNYGCKAKWESVSRRGIDPLSEFYKGGRSGKNSPSWKGGLAEKVCRMCSKKFTIHPCWVKRGAGIFCSRECQGKWRTLYIKGKDHPLWKGGKSVMKICKVCKKVFYTYPAWTKRKGRKNDSGFCSQHCKGIWVVKYCMPYKDTSIELAIELELKKRNISYQKQAPVEGIALVDFLLLDKTIIQCDGNYWHAPQKAKDKDNNQDFQLVFKGYKVFRFTETEINKSPARCINRLLKQSNNFSYA